MVTEVLLHLSRKKSIAALVINVKRVIAYGNGKAQFLDVTWEGPEAALENAVSGEKVCKRGFRNFTSKLLKRLPELRAVRNFERGLNKTRRLHEHLVTDRVLPEDLLERCKRGTGVGIVHVERVWDEVKQLPGGSAACGTAPGAEKETLVGYLSKEMRKSYHRSDQFTGRRWAALGKWNHVKAREILYGESLQGVDRDGRERVLLTWREMYGETMRVLSPRTAWDWQEARKLSVLRAEREFARWVDAGIVELAFEERYSVKQEGGSWAVELTDGWRLSVEEVRERLRAGRKLPGVMLGALTVRATQTRMTKRWTCDWKECRFNANRRIRLLHSL